jgi:hypothetical protein
VTACFTSASICKSLPGQVLLKRSKEMVITGSSFRTAGSVVHNFLAPVTSELTVWNQVISSHLNRLRNTCLASDLQQMPTRNELPPPGHRHKTQISSAPWHNSWCQGAIKARMSVVATWRSDVCHLLHTCHRFLGLRISFALLHILHIQGGSNMTGTVCDFLTHKSSRSYLNHLVHRDPQLSHTVILFQKLSLL